MLSFFLCRFGARGLGVGLRGASRLMAVQPLRGHGFTGALLALTGDALEEFGSRFVLRVLRRQFAAEGMTQDGLAQGLCAGQLDVEVGFKVVDYGKLIFGGVDDRLLLDQGREWNGARNDVGIV